MDGHFVPNLTMGPFIVEACRRATKLPLNVHLMVEHPENLLEAFAKAGASHLIVHVETCPDIAGTLKMIKGLGCQGRGDTQSGHPCQQPGTSPASGRPCAGFDRPPRIFGSGIHAREVPKIAEIRRRLDEIGSSAWLEVDGGISVQTISQVREAGADAFVAAKAIFGHPDGIAAGIQALKELDQSLELVIKQKSRLAP